MSQVGHRMGDEFGSLANQSGNHLGHRPGHPADESLIAMIDDELTDQQTLTVRGHLAGCEECRLKYGRLQAISTRVESMVASCSVETSHAQRAALAARLDEAMQVKSIASRSKSLVWRFGWSMGVAATLAVGVLLTAHIRETEKTLVAADSQYVNSGTFEIDGETFVALPYSNPDLPLSGPRIVEMQVPVSSLADAGVVFEPIMNEVSAGNRSVLADVLLGTDGQPLGVHVLESE